MHVLSSVDVNYPVWLSGKLLVGNQDDDFISRVSFFFVGICLCQISLQHGFGLQRSSAFELWGVQSFLMF
jgi:hypothetical protein